MSGAEFAGMRGRLWFAALAGSSTVMAGDPPSVLTADASLGPHTARFLCVVPDPKSRFPRAQHGEVGLQEAYTLATRVHEVIDCDAGSKSKRPIIAIVDVKSQAYGRLEEIEGIFLAGAAAADAYASARMAGHPVIALIVGHAISGGFLTHGYQANRILAFDDPQVMIHAMHEEAAARITRRSVASLEELGKRILPLSYDVKDYAKLGLLFRLIEIDNADSPQPASVAAVTQHLLDAIADSQKGSPDLSNRWQSEDARTARKSSILVREEMARQWQLA
jgi:malonate decarboxylase gamma subunit